ncbi:MAG: oligosaccharide flippase family protein [Candidatus Delongbacteria bacterium]|nr:oligosaccharide flippase family protein [Candidatus Delongbacteria bacterium]MBN2834316.1 oligosaccharide flippase family protein [Candidatus Delongbacteria bacterium]
MRSENNSYKQIVKATSIFGGVQFFQIVVQIIQTKLIVILIGPIGIGIYDLLNSTIQLVNSFTNFSLRTSAVKTISQPDSNVGQVIFVLKRIVWGTGILGILVMIIFSDILSLWSFGSTDYRLSIIWISITLLITQISTAQIAILQAFRKYKMIAQSALSGSIIGLFISIPIYFYFKIDGVVPVIILSSISSMLRSWYYVKKLSIIEFKPTRQEFFVHFKEIISLGIVLSLSGILVNISNYGIRLYISDIGGLESVGLYASGYFLITKYVNLIFQAMGADFLPRLSASIKCTDLYNKIVNDQIEISMLLIFPLICFFIVFSDIIIVLLYSDQFLPIVSMVNFGMASMLVKAISWSIVFILVAKGETKVFSINEFFTIIHMFLFSLIGFKYFRFVGVGFSMIIGYSLYFIQVYIITKKMYGFKLNHTILKLLTIQFTIVSILLVISSLIVSNIKFLFCTIILIYSLYFTFRELNRRIDLKKIPKKLKILINKKSKQ